MSHFLPNFNNKNWIYYAFFSANPSDLRVTVGDHNQFDNTVTDDKINVISVSSNLPDEQTT